MNSHVRQAADDDFKDALRRATARSHERLDDTLRQLNLRTAEGRYSFSRIHLGAYSQIGAACGWMAAEASELLRQTHERLQREIGPSPTLVPAEAPLLGDSIAYTLLGSQLGLAVLRKSLAPDERTGVFAHEPDIAAWKRFVTRMTDHPPRQPLRARIISDAQRAFAVFQSETEQELQRLGNAAA